MSGNDLIADVQLESTGLVHEIMVIYVQRYGHIIQT